MLILAIETSCDETSLAFLESSFELEMNSENFVDYINSFEILAHTISTQIATHAEYGGVIPEIGARLHAEQIHYLFVRTVLKAVAKTTHDRHPELASGSPTTQSKNPNENIIFDFNNPKIREFLSKIDYICVTTEPGLKSALRVGEEFAKTIQFYLDLKLGKKAEIIAVNHLKGHVFSSFYQVNNYFLVDSAKLSDNGILKQVQDDGGGLSYVKNTPVEGVKPKVSESLEITIENEEIPSQTENEENTKFFKQTVFPNLHLLVSGGNSQLILLQNPFELKIIGQTLDDAAGECFDKTARMFGLSYPGGVSLAKIAGLDDSNYLNFPVSMKNNPELNFSFSGLKTAVRYFVQKNELLNYEEKLSEIELQELLNGDLKTLTTPKPSVSPLQKGYLQPKPKLILIKKLCISIQTVIVEQLIIKVKKAIKEHKPNSIGISGGVSANRLLRQKIQEIADGKSIFIPDLNLTGDNAVMIGLAGAVITKNQ